MSVSFEVARFDRRERFLPQTSASPPTAPTWSPPHYLRLTRDATSCQPRTLRERRRTWGERENSPASAANAPKGASLSFPFPFPFPFSLSFTTGPFLAGSASDFRPPFFSTTSGYSETDDLRRRVGAAPLFPRKAGWKVRGTWKEWRVGRLSNGSARGRRGDGTRKGREGKERREARELLNCDEARMKRERKKERARRTFQFSLK